MLSAAAPTPRVAPTLMTQRLTLRAYTPDDALVLHRLINDPAIASTALNIPHPYELAMAETFIAQQARQREAGESLSLGIFLSRGLIFIGGAGLDLTPRHAAAELGYWIGRPYWGQGYCTEAGRALLRYAFDTLGLHRVEAWHFSRNPASGRVMQKLGMRHEGHCRQRLRKLNQFEDVELYAILATDPPGGR